MKIYKAPSTQVAYNLGRHYIVYYLLSHLEFAKARAVRAHHFQVNYRQGQHEGGKRGGGAHEGEQATPNREQVADALPNPRRDAVVHRLNVGAEPLQQSPAGTRDRLKDEENEMRKFARGKAARGKIYKESTLRK